MTRIVAATDRPSLRLALEHLLGRLGLDFEILAGDQLDARLPGDDDLQWVLDARLVERMARWPELPVLWLVARGEASPSGACLVWPEQLDELGSRLRTLLRPAERESDPEPPAAGQAFVRPLSAEPPEPRVHRSALWARVETKIRQLAPHDIPVLIHGESGTGKELVARALHEASGRGKEPFVAVHCGAIPADLLESELFGHERGAFTDAHQRHIGRFEAAGRGTLFLDEIGEMPLGLQSKLLRVLQEREIRRIGGSEELPVRARVLAATHRDLRAMSHQGQFREDLLHRLLVGQLELPPLRERPEDLRLLTELFLMRIARETGRDLEGLDRAAWRRIEHHGWPGNVRELENLLRRSVLMCSRDLLGEGDLAMEEREPSAAPLESELRRRIAASGDPSLALAGMRDDLEAVAEKLGITPVRPDSSAGRS